MAGKSFLSRLGGNKGKYKVNKNAINSTAPAKKSHMEGKYQQTSGRAGNEPPTKKRKTEDDEGEGDIEEALWDDSMEFTQADLDDIEVQASQAYTEPSNPVKPDIPVSLPQPSTSTSHMTVQGRDSTGTFLKPQLSRTSSSSTSSLNGGHHPNTGHNLSSHSNTSHNSSSNSSHSHHTANSSYPSSLSGYGSTSSSSLKSGSSVEMVCGQKLSGSLSRGISSDSLDLTGILGRNQTMNQSTREEVSKYKQECSSLKLQLEKMKEEMCVKDGENKLLRDNLSKKDSELGTLKMEKISQINQQNKQQNDREKSLKTDLSKLQTQLQFKDQEERELGNRCRELETQLKNLQTVSQALPQSQATSPKPRRVPVDERTLMSPKGLSSFPSKKSFLAPEVSPRKPAKPSEKGDNEASTSTTVVKQTLERRKHGLGLKTTKRQQSAGSQLVARLLDVTPSATGSISERGIVGLLNSPSTSTSLCNLQFDRDKDTSLLSPVRNRRLSDFRTLINEQDRQETISLVSTDHFNMAIHGLTNLLRSNHHTDMSVLHNRAPPGGVHEQTQGTRSDLGGSEKELSSANMGKSNLDNAVLILPLLDDYLKRYIEMLDTALESSNISSGTNSSSSASPGSYETSLESPTGSLGLLLKSTANYANDLENLALASLQTLHVLVSCEGVRRVLLHCDNDVAEMTTPSNNTASSSEMEVVNRENLTKVIHLPLKSILKLHLLRKVIRLSNPGSKAHLCNSQIVQTCLKTLGVLAVHAENHHIGSVMCVLSDESLQNCIECETEPKVVLRAMILFKVLVKSNLVVSSLCTNTTGCVLMSVYGICLTGKGLGSVQEKIKLNIYQLIIESIYYIASCHKGGMTILLESDCQCSIEVVKSIVCLLHSVMKLYIQEQKSIDTSSQLNMGSNDKCPEKGYKTRHSLDQNNILRHILEILQAGLRLLHLMSQHDSSFMNRHVAVQHQYVKLICGLTHIFKNVPMENNESEMSALQDLWDFNQDDSELSQDTDSEENEGMETS